MDPALLSILALLAGAALGWFLASRPLADLRARLAAAEGAGAEREGTIKAMTVDLAATSEKARALEASVAALEEIRRERDELAPALAAARQSAADAERVRDELARVRSDREALRAELERLRADAENFAEQKRLLIQSQEALRKEFENAGSKVLERAQEAFLSRAQARFEESEKTSAERLKSLLAPVDQRLRSYEEQVQSLEKQRVDAFGQLFGQIEALRAGQEAVRTEALRLGNSLRNAPKARGRWGEQQLKNVLEQCGLTEHTDFVTEHSIETEEGRLRPDAIVRIPGNKQLVIDAKVSLNAYQDAFEAEDEEARKAHLDSHAVSMRNHIQTLATKSYQSQFENAPDYVIMFVPGEHFIAAALEHDSALWDFAFKNKVLLASPTNLVAIARTIAQVWQQEGLAREAREIGKLAAGLYDSLAKTQDDLMKTGVHLGRAVNSFNDFARTYEGNVLSRARRLTDKHIQIGKREISEDVALVEVSPRYANPNAQDVAALEAADKDGEGERRDAAE